MRADRLLAILMHLQANRRATAGALAERLEVSARTIHRDMEALSLAGVPVYAQRGAGGGWLLPESYRAQIPGLSEAEVQALVLGQPPRLMADLGLQHAADAALLKLLAALPAIARRGAEHARQRLYVDAAGWRRPDDVVPFLGALQDGVWRDVQMRLGYRRGDGTAVERVVDPLGLVAKGALWYLVAAVGGSPRTYRISRVLSVELLDTPAVRPDGFDLAAFWQQSNEEFVATLPHYPATVRVAPAAAPGLERGGAYVRVEAVGQPEADGWRAVRLMADTEAVAAAFVLGFGAEMQVVAPAELRERVVRTAHDVVAFYATLRDASATTA